MTPLISYEQSSVAAAGGWHLLTVTIPGVHVQDRLWEGHRKTAARVSYLQVTMCMKMETTRSGFISLSSFCFGAFLISLISGFVLKKKILGVESPSTLKLFIPFFALSHKKIKCIIVCGSSAMENLIKGKNTTAKTFNVFIIGSISFLIYVLAGAKLV